MLTRKTHTANEAKIRTQIFAHSNRIGTRLINSCSWQLVGQLHSGQILVAESEAARFAVLQT